MAEFDRAAFIATFREESGEHLQRLNEGVIALEQDPRDRALVEQMLRDAHTLKGSSRMVGLIAISDIAHRLEDVFVRVRDGELAYTPEMSDVVFEALDTMRFLAEHAGDESAEALDTAALLDRLAAVGPAPEGAPVPEPAAAVPESGPSAPAPAEGLSGASLPAADAPPGAPAGEKTDDESAAAERLRVAEMTTFRVRADHVDSLLNLVSEVVIAQIKAEQRSADLRALAGRSGIAAKTWASLREEIERAVPASDAVGDGLEARMLELDEALGGQRKELFELTKGYTDDVSRASAIIDDLQERAMQLRMLPVSTVFAQYPRAVRDLAKDAGKQVELVTEGGETELDKKVLEEIADPLVHLMRNAVDHGIEKPEAREAAGKPPTGTIRLTARQEGDHIVISLADDGAGIDPEKVRVAAVKRGYVTEAEARAMSDRQAMFLVFESGFSTSPIITELSGRGVGLDVVRRFIVERLKGTLDVESTVGAGTEFTVRIPLTLAIIRALLVRLGPRLFALPTATVEETLRVDPSDVVRLEGRDVVRRELRTIPLIPLADILGTPAAAPGGALHVVVVGLSGVRLGFVVDGFDGEQQIVIKTLGTHLRKVDNIAGATILGAGEVVLILDVPDLVDHARTRAGGRVRAAEPPRVPSGPRRILICEDSFTTRELERSIFEAAGYEVETATDGAQGLGRLQAGLAVEAVVTDVQMPRMDGFSLSRAIKSDPSLRHLPVVIVTSLEREEERAEGISAGADAYITKSVFNQDTLIETVERLIR